MKKSLAAKFILAICVTGACAGTWGARLTSQSYSQDGLIAQFDAIDNVGVGQHDSSATVWKDLKGSASIALETGTSWIDRALDASTKTLTIAGMPAFYLDSVSSELAMNRLASGPAGSYPRLIHHPGGDGLYSVYMQGTDSYPILYIGNKGGSGQRPSFNSFSAGTIGMVSDTTGYRTYNNGNYANSAGTNVVSHVQAAAASWNMNRQSNGTLQGYYRAFRHYNRALTATEIARHYMIDQFRFFSYSVTGTGSETPLAWATAGWLVPQGRSSTCPNTDTNDVVQIVDATVSVAASDGMALKALSLEDGAKLAMGTNVEACVQILWVEGESVGRGVYTGAEGTTGTKVDWITGPGHVRVSGTIGSKFPTVAVQGFGSSSYVQDGLVTQLDAIDNVGTGTHDASAAKWLDLVGNVSVTLTTNIDWTAGRYFHKAGDGLPVYFGMPAYRRDSLTCEVPINIDESGSNSAGGYPRIFANGEAFSIYFSGSSTTAQVYFQGQKPDDRPSLGTFRTGTAAAFGDTTGYGGSVDGVIKSKTNHPATNGVSIAADNWGLGHAGKLNGSYGGLRFYNRCLTVDELAWNALVDKFRFFSYAYANDGSEIAWADVAWSVPEGETATAPSTTNHYVTISQAKVSVATTDALALKGLSLEKGATLAVPSGAVVSTKMLYVNGAAIDHGIYTGSAGTEGQSVDWITGAGQVRVGGGTDRGIPTVVPVADADGWYTFGLLNGSSDQRWIVGEHPIWDDYAFPAGAKLRLQGYLLLETVPDIFADYDTSLLQRVFVNGTRAYAANRPFDVPTGALFRFVPGKWTTYEGNSNVLKSANSTLAAQTAGDVSLNGASARFEIRGDGLPNLAYSGLLSGTGLISIGSYGRQGRLTGGFALTGSTDSNWQNGTGIWLDTLAVTSGLQTVTLSGCGDSHGMTVDYSASYVMFGKNASAATADHPLTINRLNGNASSRFDSAGRRWRSGGHILVWGSNTVHVGSLYKGIHVVADRKEQDCTNGYLARSYLSQGIGFFAVDAFDSGTIWGSTNIALTVGTVASGTAFDYTYQSNGVNRLSLDITGTCASSATIQATDLAMLPARISGFTGSISLTDTEAKSYEIPIDFTVGPTGLCTTVGCSASGTLVAAPETSAIDVTFPTTGIDPAPGKYPVARFSAGGNLLKNWSVTLNGAQTTHAMIDHHSVKVGKDSTGIWVGIDLPGWVMIVR